MVFANKIRWAQIRRRLGCIHISENSKINILKHFISSGKCIESLVYLILALWEKRNDDFVGNVSNISSRTRTWCSVMQLWFLVFGWNQLNICSHLLLTIYSLFFRRAYFNKNTCWLCVSPTAACAHTHTHNTYLQRGKENVCIRLNDKHTLCLCLRAASKCDAMAFSQYGCRCQQPNWNSFQFTNFLFSNSPYIFLPHCWGASQVAWVTLSLTLSLYTFGISVPIFGWYIFGLNAGTGNIYGDVFNRIFLYPILRIAQVQVDAGSCSYERMQLLASKSNAMTK